MNIRIKMLKTVRPAFHTIYCPIRPGTVLYAGRIYQATTAESGCFCGICDNGELLGVQPGEYEVVDAEKVERK